MPRAFLAHLGKPSGRSKIAPTRPKVSIQAVSVNQKQSHVLFFSLYADSLTQVTFGPRTLHTTRMVFRQNQIQNIHLWVFLFHMLSHVSVRYYKLEKWRRGPFWVTKTF